MSINADEITVRRLGLIRQLYTFSSAQAAQVPSTLNRIIAVIGLDLAVENLLRAIISAIDPSFRIDNDTSFHKLIQKSSFELDKAGFGQLPDEARIKHLHHIRNDAQHNGRFPSYDEVIECRLIARDFLSQLIKQVWGISFDQISPSDLVVSTVSRKFFEQAFESFKAGDYKQSIEYSNAGLSHAIRMAKEVIFPRSKHRLWEGMGPVQWNIGLGGPSRTSIDPQIIKELDKLKEEHKREGHHITSKISGLRSDVKDELDSLEEPLLFTMLDLNYAEHLSFRKLAGKVRFHGRDYQFEAKGGRQDVTSDEAENALSYCVNAVMQIEGKVIPLAPEDAAES